jgi:hypothetical protein
VRDQLRYDKMVEDALRGVVRQALARIAADGLPDPHSFYITFRTRFPGIILPDFLLARYPDEMTIVLEHQFWNLTVTESLFSVGLSFQGRAEILTIPFDAILSFSDPAVKFVLQFQAADADSDESEATPPTDQPSEPPPDKSAAVVTLDAFRKK